ncbi:CPCC family cysteine-rich protein [Clostridium sp. UBA1056]|uniref:CPCC family cysteine-rich protein n=1 Tax=unclassified Clostridium TaxID=2614128 RepID=UPI0032177A0B
MINICVLCNWEDDGQDYLDEDLIKGGPNGHYSLTEARDNFKKYLIMYSPDRDMRITGYDTKEVKTTKKELIEVYNEIMKEKNSIQLDKAWNLAYNLEDRVHKITLEKIRKYENNLKRK